MTSGCDLFFKHLFVPVYLGGKVLLNNVSGYFPKNSFVCVLGCSGSGKTTLLNNLSGYRCANSTVEILQVNGKSIRFGDMKSISCYITQDIHLNDSLTTEENMLFAADFKMGENYSQKKKTNNVHDLLDCLGLSHTKMTKVGKLSSGERKRVAVAMEMLSNPKIIFLDEPTTGLDMVAASQMINFLKSLCTNGRIVICSIHQVSASHFELFDWIYGIADGKCAYSGPPQKMVTFFDGLGLTCSLYHNPADFFIEVCSGDYGRDKPEMLISAANVINHFKTESATCTRRKDTSQKFAKVNKSYKLKTLLRREIIKSKRSIFFALLRLYGSNLIALFISALFWNCGNDAATVFLSFNVVLVIVASETISALFPILTFPLEIEVVRREVHNNYYSSLEYYIVTLLIDIPINLVMTTTSTLIIYYCTGQLMEMERICLFLIFTNLHSCIITSIGFYFGTMFTIAMGFVCVSMMSLLWIIISGFLISIKDLPYIFDQISQLTYMRHVVAGKLVALFGMNRSPIPCPDYQEFCLYSNPNKLLFDLGIDTELDMTSFYVLFVWLIGIQTLTYFSITHRLRNI